MVERWEPEPDWGCSGAEHIKPKVSPETVLLRSCPRFRLQRCRGMERPHPKFVLLLFLTTGEKELVPWIATIFPVAIQKRPLDGDKVFPHFTITWRSRQSLMIQTLFKAKLSSFWVLLNTNLPLTKPVVIRKVYVRSCLLKRRFQVCC